jgi:hypothetical protein
LTGATNATSAPLALPKRDAFIWLSSPADEAVAWLNSSMASAACHSRP